MFVFYDKKQYHELRDFCDRNNVLIRRFYRFRSLPNDIYVMNVSATPEQQTALLLQFGTIRLADYDSDI